MPVIAREEGVDPGQPKPDVAVGLADLGAEDSEAEKKTAGGR